MRKEGGRAGSVVSQFYEGITLSKHFTMLLRITRPSSQPAEAEEASGGREKSEDAQSAGSESRRLKPEH